MKTILIILFITQGFGVDDSVQVTYGSPEKCERALSQMHKTRDANRSWHRGTQTVAFCAPEGTDVPGGESVIQKLRANRHGNQ